MSEPSIRGTLLSSLRSRLAVAGSAVVCLWAAVLWVYFWQPVLQQPVLVQPVAKAVDPAAPPSVAAPAASETIAAPQAAGEAGLRLVVASGAPAPGGGVFDRFDVEQQPIVAPVNARGQVAFYASLAHAKPREGLFLASAGRIARIVAVGDAAPGGGSFSEFAKHPAPALNEAGKVAFGASVANARATEGVFLANGSDIVAIALSGADAPGIVNGSFVEFDAPVLNNRDEVAFVATVRRHRESLEVLYLYSSGKLRKLLAAGELAPRKRAPGVDALARKGAFDQFGAPALNNRGVVAFPAIVEHGDALGGIFLAGAHDLQFLLAAGDLAPSGAMLVRFSERVAIDDEDNVAFVAHLSGDQADAEAIFRLDANGLASVATTGGAAPGGGRFAAFGPWPSLGAIDSVVTVAALEEGPAPLAIFAGPPGAFTRLIAPGQATSPGGAPLAPFALNAVTSAASNGGVTFATMPETVGGASGIYYFGPAPVAR